jgi:hypothetical protein
MDHRVRLARAVERRCGKAVQAMIAKLKPWMLAGDEQVGRLAESGEGMGNRAELDGFGTRSYNERNTILAQLPPWLRPAICRRSGRS